MTTPQFPADESLQRGIALADQSTAAGATEGQSIEEVQRLTVVEDVALAIVGGQGAWRLIPECGTTFDGQCLIRVDKGLADGQGIRCVILQMYAHKGARHGRIAGQKQWLACLEEAREAVANGIGAKIGTIVAHTHHNRCGFVACQGE